MAASETAKEILKIPELWNLSSQSSTGSDERVNELVRGEGKEQYAGV